MAMAIKDSPDPERARAKRAAASARREYNRRRTLWARQNGLCCYCGMPCLLQPYGTPLVSGDATVEHLVPLSKGGPARSVDNQMMACLDCNRERGFVIRRRRRSASQ